VPAPREAWFSPVFREILDLSGGDAHNARALAALSRAPVFVSVGPFMNVLQEPSVQRSVLLIAALAILVLVLVYVIGRIRAGMTEEEGGASDLLTNFREMHAKGELSDQEFRTIKTQLSARLQRELRDAEETR
jgi:uncharacterized membrane protein